MKFKITDLLRSPVSRLLLLTTCYAAALTVSLGFSYLLRFDFKTDDFYPGANHERTAVIIRSFFLWIIPMKLLVLIFFRQLEGLLSYFSIPDLRRLLGANIASSLLMFFVWAFVPGQLTPPPWCYSD